MGMKKKGIIILIVVLLVLAGAAGAIYYVLHNKKASNEELVYATKISDLNGGYDLTESRYGNGRVTGGQGCKP